MDLKGAPHQCVPFGMHGTMGHAFLLGHPVGHAQEERFQLEDRVVLLRSDEFDGRSEKNRQSKLGHGVTFVTVGFS